MFAAASSTNGWDALILIALIACFAFAIWVMER
jgi:hypothetical protein